LGLSTFTSLVHIYLFCKISKVGNETWNILLINQAPPDSVGWFNIQ
jgi:hypothetical protein